MASFTVSEYEDLVDAPFELPQTTLNDIAKGSRINLNECQLQRPDGEAICFCPNDVSEWYVNRGLAHPSKPSEPPAVRLDFFPETPPLKYLTTQPVQRQSDSTEVEPLSNGVYYIRGVGCVCVVCGEDEEFVLWKDIVPKEYRELFPVSKELSFGDDNNADDLVSMCVQCLKKSNEFDFEFREELFRRCGDITEGKRVQGSHFSSASNVVNRKSFDAETSVSDSELKSRAERVVDWMAISRDDDSGNLFTKLQLLWRQNFFDNMNPKLYPNPRKETAKIKNTEDSFGRVKKDGNNEISSKLGEEDKQAQKDDVKEESFGSDDDANSVIIGNVSSQSRDSVPQTLQVVSSAKSEGFSLATEQFPMYQSVANFAVEPVVRQPNVESPEPMKDSMEMGVVGFDSLLSVWSVGQWTVLRSLIASVEKRNRDMLSGEAGQHQTLHGLEAGLSAWTAGLSVIVQQLFNIKMQRESQKAKHVTALRETNGSDPSSMLRIKPKNLSNLAKEEVDSALTTSSRELILAVWTLGLWPQVKALKSTSVDNISGNLLNIWSLGLWTMVKLIFEKNGLSLEQLKIDSAALTLNHERNIPLVSEPVQPVHSDLREELCQIYSSDLQSLFLSFWTLGAWPYIKFIQTELLKRVESHTLQEPAIAKIEKEEESEHMTSNSMKVQFEEKEDDSIKLVKRQIKTFKPKIKDEKSTDSFEHIEIKSDDQSIGKSVTILNRQGLNCLVSAWTFGLWDFFTLLLNQKHCLSSTNFLENLKETNHLPKTEIDAKIKAIQNQRSSVVANSDNLSAFMFLWTFGCWQIFIQSFKELMQIIGLGKNSIVSPQTEMSDDTVVNKNISSKPLHEKTLEKLGQENISDNIPIYNLNGHGLNYILSMWTCGLWDFLQIMIKQESTLWPDIFKQEATLPQSSQAITFDRNIRLVPGREIAQKSVESTTAAFDALFDCYSFGIYTSLRDFLYSICETKLLFNDPNKSARDLLFTLWTFGSWSIFRTLQNPKKVTMYELYSKSLSAENSSKSLPKYKENKINTVKKSEFEYDIIDTNAMFYSIWTLNGYSVIKDILKFIKNKGRNLYYASETTQSNNAPKILKVISSPKIKTRTIPKSKKENFNRETEFLIRKVTKEKPNIAIIDLPQKHSFERDAGVQSQDDKSPKLFLNTENTVIRNNVFSKEKEETEYDSKNILISKNNEQNEKNDISRLSIEKEKDNSSQINSSLDLAETLISSKIVEKKGKLSNETSPNSNKKISSAGHLDQETIPIKKQVTENEKLSKSEFIRGIDTKFITSSVRKQDDNFNESSMDIKDQPQILSFERDLGVKSHDVKSPKLISNLENIKIENNVSIKAKEKTNDESENLKVSKTKKFKDTKDIPTPSLEKEEDNLSQINSSLDLTEPLISSNITKDKGKFPSESSFNANQNFSSVGNLDKKSVPDNEKLSKGKYVFINDTEARASMVRKKSDKLDKSSWDIEEMPQKVSFERDVVVQSPEIKSPNLFSNPKNIEIENNVCNEEKDETNDESENSESSLNANQNFSPAGNLDKKTVADNEKLSKGKYVIINDTEVRASMVRTKADKLDKSSWDIEEMPQKDSFERDVGVQSPEIKSPNLFSNPKNIEIENNVCNEKKDETNDESENILISKTYKPKETKDILTASIEKEEDNLSQINPSLDLTEPLLSSNITKDKEKFPSESSFNANQNFSPVGNLDKKSVTDNEKLSEGKYVIINDTEARTSMVRKKSDKLDKSSWDIEEMPQKDSFERDVGVQSPEIKSPNLFSNPKNIEIENNVCNKEKDETNNESENSEYSLNANQNFSPAGNLDKKSVPDNEKLSEGKYVVINDTEVRASIVRKKSDKLNKSSWDIEEMPQKDSFERDVGVQSPEIKSPNLFSNPKNIEIENNVCNEKKDETNNESENILISKTYKPKETASIEKEKENSSQIHPSLDLAETLISSKIIKDKGNLTDETSPNDNLDFSLASNSYLGTVTFNNNVTENEKLSMNKYIILDNSEFISSTVVKQGDKLDNSNKDIKEGEGDITDIGVQSQGIKSPKLFSNPENIKIGNVPDNGKEETKDEFKNISKTYKQKETKDILVPSTENEKDNSLLVNPSLNLAETFKSSKTIEDKEKITNLTDNKKLSDDKNTIFNYPDSEFITSSVAKQEKSLDELDFSQQNKGLSQKSHNFSKPQNDSKNFKLTEANIERSEKQTNTNKTDIGNCDQIFITFEKDKELEKNNFSKISDPKELTQANNFDINSKESALSHSVENANREKKLSSSDETVMAKPLYENFEKSKACQQYINESSSNVCEDTAVGHEADHSELSPTKSCVLDSITEKETETEFSNGEITKISSDNQPADEFTVPYSDQKTDLSKKMIENSSTHDYAADCFLKFVTKETKASISNDIIFSEGPEFRKISTDDQITNENQNSTIDDITSDQTSTETASTNKDHRVQKFVENNTVDMEAKSIDGSETIKHSGYTEENSKKETESESINVENFSNLSGKEIEKKSRDHLKKEMVTSQKTDLFSSPSYTVELYQPSSNDVTEDFLEDGLKQNMQLDLELTSFKGDVSLTSNTKSQGSPLDTELVLNKSQEIVTISNPSYFSDSSEKETEKKPFNTKKPDFSKHKTFEISNSDQDNNELLETPYNDRNKEKPVSQPDPKEQELPVDEHNEKINMATESLKSDDVVKPKYSTEEINKNLPDNNLPGINKYNILNYPEQKNNQLTEISVTEVIEPESRIDGDESSDKNPSAKNVMLNTNSEKNNSPDVESKGTHDAFDISESIKMQGSVRVDLMTKTSFPNDIDQESMKKYESDITKECVSNHDVSDRETDVQANDDIDLKSTQNLSPIAESSSFYSQFVILKTKFEHEKDVLITEESSNSTVLVHDHSKQIHVEAPNNGIDVSEWHGIIPNPLEYDVSSEAASNSASTDLEEYEIVSFPSSPKRNMENLDFIEHISSQDSFSDVKDEKKEDFNFRIKINKDKKSVSDSSLNSSKYSSSEMNKQLSEEGLDGLSDFSFDSFKKTGFVNSALTSTPAKRNTSIKSETSSDSMLFETALDSQLELTDVQEAKTQDTLVDEPEEEIWITETSEIVTSFVTETIKTVKVDEHGHEVIEESVRILGPDGKEISQDLASLMKTPVLSRKQ